ncbi:MAG TPA: carboxypeptidase-like regulatory domain-containing protein, partial [Xanthomonadales bacterium]|nr:carboxypeptidase-like regulatory domain-containing protein [Xanthomonadales bacterium]
MNNRIRVILSLAVAALVLLVPLAALAQETTSALRVTVYDPAGNPVPDASVTVTDTRTNSSRTMTTSAGGTASVSGLQVGGPYTIQVQSAAHQSQSVTGINLRLGELYAVPFQLGGDTTMEEVIVTASAMASAQLALGPSSSFDLHDLEDYPTINRDIRDVIRFDPRIYQDNGFVGAIHCGGANPRFNSLTL